MDQEIKNTEEFQECLNDLENRIDIAKRFAFNHKWDDPLYADLLGTKLELAKIYVEETDDLITYISSKSNS